MPFSNSSEVFPELCWAISSAFLQLVYWDLLVFYCYLIGWVKLELLYCFSLSFWYSRSKAFNLHRDVRKG